MNNHDCLSLWCKSNLGGTGDQSCLAHTHTETRADVALHQPPPHQKEKKNQKAFLSLASTSSNLPSKRLSVFFFLPFLLFAVTRPPLGCSCIAGPQPRQGKGGGGGGHRLSTLLSSLPFILPSFFSLALPPSPTKKIKPEECCWCTGVGEKAGGGWGWDKSPPLGLSLLCALWVSADG